MSTAADMSFSRSEQIAATVLEVLAAIGFRGLIESAFLNLVRLGPVRDTKMTELKAELVAAEMCGWAESSIEKDGVRWHGTKDAAEACENLKRALDVQSV